MTTQPAQKAILIHILPNISRSKDNQTVKLGQLTECNMKNILIENYRKKVEQKLIPDLFLKNAN